MKTALIALATLTFSTLQASPAKVIFDTDMANDCDDAGALAVLHALADLGETEILAIVTNRKDSGNASAAACSAINHYYGRPGIPIGTDKDGAKVDLNRPPSPYTGVLRDEFPHDANPDDEMPDALDVLRRTLADQPDNSVTYCSVGALSNLEDLVRSGPDEHSPLTGRELVERKIAQTVIMGGGFPRTWKRETNIRLDPAAAVAVTNEWPAPILWQGFEVGAALITGTELQDSPEDNPVRRAFEVRPYLGRDTIEVGKPSHDQAAVLLAVRGPQKELWKQVNVGRAVFDSDGQARWSRNGDKEKHRYVRINGHPSALEKIIGQLMTAPPGNE